MARRMKKKRYLSWLMSVVICLSVLSSPVIRTDAQSPSTPEFDTGRLIVEAEHEIEDRDALEISCIYGDYYVLQYEDAGAAKEAYERLRQEKDILNVSPDEKITLDETTVCMADDEDTPWAASQMGFDVFWDYMEDYGQLSAVKVAVLDTGIDTDLEIFEGRILSGGQNYCSSNPDRLPEDDHGHGTMVSDIIVENTSDNVQILPMKVMDKNGEGYDSHIVAAIAYAMDYGVDIINMSIGGNAEKDIYEDLIDSAEELGIAVIVAAGNESRDVSECTPANVNSSITISSVDEDGNFSKFSNYGNQIDFCAPGQNIVVRGIGGQKYNVSGTSFSAPYATAAFALVKSVRYGMNGMQIYSLIQNYATDLGTAGWDSRFGYGRINLARIAQTTSQSEIIYGDVDGDFDVSVLDAYLILQYVVGRQELDNSQMSVADIDRDGDVTVLDVLEIIKLTVQS